MSNDDVQGPLPTSVLEALEIVEQCSCGAIGDVYYISYIYNIIIYNIYIYISG